VTLQIAEQVLQLDEFCSQDCGEGLGVGNMGIEASSPRESETRHSKSLAENILCVLLVAGLYISVSPACFAQQEQRVEQPLTQTVSQTATDSPKASAQAEQPVTPAQSDMQSDQKKKRVPRGAFVLAPLPISSPALGSGIVPVIGYIFPFSMKDKVSPPSVIGAAGLATSNASRGFAVGGQLYLKENTYRITAGFARGNVNYDIYGNLTALNLKLPLKQTGQAFFSEFLRSVGWKFFLGPRFITGRSFLTIRPGSNEQNAHDVCGIQCGSSRISRLRNRAKNEGLDPNQWFGNVELVAAKDVGREPVQYVSNIYKYYVAYKLTQEQSRLQTQARPAPIQ